MKIAAKSAIRVDQLKDKENKDAKYVELHLIEKDVDSEESLQKTLNILKETKLIPIVVHIPIDRRFTIEGLLSDYNFYIIENCFKLGQALSKRLSRPIDIVMHQELDLPQMETWGMYEWVKKGVGYLLSEYPDTVVNLENLMLIAPDRYIRSNYKSENVELCRQLREDLKTDRVGVVLDTCHAIATIRLVDLIVPSEVHEPLFLKEYFLNSKEYLNIIHLANARRYGIDEEHGTGFDTDGELELLKEMIGYIKEIDFKGILTLEVQEEDYLDSVVFDKLFKQVNSLI